MMRKIIGLLFILFLLTACGKSDAELVKVYEKMNAGTELLNGYSIDLRVYGESDGNIIKDIVRINNYKDNAFRVSITNARLNFDTTTPFEENVQYIINQKIYVQDAKTKEYAIIRDRVVYSNPLIYLIGLKNVTEMVSTKTELIGNNEYTVYDVKFNKDAMGQILADTVFIGNPIKDEPSGKIYVDKDGYLYRIIYEIEDLEINASYFGINNSSEIVLPTLEERGSNE